MPTLLELLLLRALTPPHAQRQVAHALGCAGAVLLWSLVLLLALGTLVALRYGQWQSAAVGAVVLGGLGWWRLARRAQQD
jgi:hypothetical protein